MFRQTGNRFAVTDSRIAGSAFAPGWAVVDFARAVRSTGSAHEEFLRPIVDRLARLGAVIVAEPYHGPGFRHDRRDAVEQGLARHRLLEKLVDAEFRGLHHP